MQVQIFDSQQEGEQILYECRPHVLSMYVAIGKTVLLSAVLFGVVWLIGSIVSGVASILRAVGLTAAFLLSCAGIWWNHTVYARSKTYLTDRRIVRLEVVSPFFQTKRSLFWSEALKTKAFAPNLLYRFLKIGTVVVEPHLSDREDVRVTDVYYFEDLGNYIDKILYTVKNAPSELSSLHAFIPKPRGQRDRA